MSMLADKSTFFLKFGAVFIVKNNRFYKVSYESFFSYFKT